MSADAFLDTNIFVYANDQREPAKREVALRLIEDLTAGGTGAVSLQVVQEFFNVVLTKSPQKMPYTEARRFLEIVFRPLLVALPPVALASTALDLHGRFLLSWYDSLIVAAAQYAGCAILYSGDFQHGQQFGSVTVRNPFL
jgi:predicted nucleic acid-binding protein